LRRRHRKGGRGKEMEAEGKVKARQGNDEVIASFQIFWLRPCILPHMMWAVALVRILNA